jgi:hypothetical protein
MFMRQPLVRFRGVVFAFCIISMMVGAESDTTNQLSSEHFANRLLSNMFEMPFVFHTLYPSQVIVQQPRSEPVLPGAARKSWKYEFDGWDFFQVNDNGQAELLYRITGRRV